MVHLDTLPEDALSAAFLRRLGCNVTTSDRERLKELLVLMADAMGTINPSEEQPLLDARWLAIKLRSLSERI